MKSKVTLKFFLSYIKNKKYWCDLIKANLIKQNYCFDDSYVKFCYWDYYKLCKKYGPNTKLETDYFGAGLYLKSDLARRNSFATGRRYSWRAEMNDKALSNKFDDKSWFYEHFSEYLGRKFIFLKETNNDEILKFIQLNTKYVLKEIHGEGGKSVDFVTFENENDVHNFVDKYSGSNYLIEEVLVQADDIRDFNPGSVNTFRIITIIDKDGNPHIAQAILRMGNGKEVDNFCSGGLAAEIDVASGVIKTIAVDQYGGEYISHPITNKQIVGYRIEDWQEYCDFCLKLAKVCPQIRFVGWDIIKNNKGQICAIEGNSTSGGNITECNSLKGHMRDFEKIANQSGGGY